MEKSQIPMKDIKQPFMSSPGRIFPTLKKRKETEKTPETMAEQSIRLQFTPPQNLPQRPARIKSMKQIPTLANIKPEQSAGLPFGEVKKMVRRSPIMPSRQIFQSIATDPEQRIQLQPSEKNLFADLGRSLQRLEIEPKKIELETQPAIKKKVTTGKEKEEIKIEEERPQTNLITTNDDITSVITKLKNNPSFTNKSVSFGQMRKGSFEDVINRVTSNDAKTAWSVDKLGKLMNDLNFIKTNRLMNQEDIIRLINQVQMKMSSFKKY